VAQMIPPIRVGRNPRGEHKLYARISENLPDQFTVFHRLEYANITEEAGVLYGEVDFLVVNKQLGMLALEVKGGDRIEFVPATGDWVSWDRNGKKFKIKNPFRQAKDGLYSLLDKIQDARVFGRKGSRLPFSFGYSVSFPDAKVSCDNFPPECARGLVIDATDLPRLREVITRLYSEFAGRSKRPGMDGKQYDGLLNKVLMPEYRVARSVGLDIQEEEEVLARMTQEQCHLLDFLGEHNRALVEGYAGTGKTFLAFEKAKRLALDGKEVLLLCFNRPLADHMSNLVEGSGTWGRSVTVNSFHGLCIDMADEMGIKYTIPVDADEKTFNKFWREDAPLLLLEALEKTDKRFDAVIIDEGQDFESEWFDVIMELLRNPKKSYLYIFYDPIQDIYHKGQTFPIEDRPFMLTKNCRNTRRIASLVARVGSIGYEFPEGAVEGKKVETIKYVGPEEQLKKIDETVRELVESEVKPYQIAILSPHRKKNSCMAGRDSVGGVKLSEDVLGRDAECITFSTLHRFKGLEADVVIFCDVDGSHPNCDRYHQYVSMSRAKHLLYVFHTKEWDAPKGVAKSQRK